MKFNKVTVTPENFTTLLLEGNAEAIYASLSKEFQQNILLSDLKIMIDQSLTDVELVLINKLVLNGLDMRMWTDPDRRLAVRVGFDTEGTIAGLRLQDMRQANPIPPQLTNMTYALPFKEEWFVFWGGDDVVTNYHAEYEVQRHAYDFFIIKDGYSYAGDPTKNENYFAFGKPLLAPADGVVVSVVNDIPDNEPVGVMNEQQPVGNVVVIDHGGEFSILAHLKQGSTTVKVDDLVKQGDVIGLAGNSGNSSEAHLHFQVSDGADLFSSKSLDIQWEGGLRPVQGDTVGKEE